MKSLLVALAVIVTSAAGAYAYSCCAGKTCCPGPCCHGQAKK